MIRTHESNGTFQTKRVGDIELSFVDYSTSKRVRVTPDIVEYSDEAPPMYDLILGKQSLQQVHIAECSQQVQFYAAGASFAKMSCTYVYLHVLTQNVLLYSAM